MIKDGLPIYRRRQVTSYNIYSLLRIFGNLFKFSANFSARRIVSLKL